MCRGGFGSGVARLWSQVGHWAQRGWGAEPRLGSAAKPQEPDIHKQFAAVKCLYAGLLPSPSSISPTPPPSEKNGSARIPWPNGRGLRTLLAFEVYNSPLKLNFTFENENYNRYYTKACTFMLAFCVTVIVFSDITCVCCIPWNVLLTSKCTQVRLAEPGPTCVLTALPNSRD